VAVQTTALSNKPRARVLRAAAAAAAIAAIAVVAVEVVVAVVAVVAATLVAIAALASTMVAMVAGAAAPTASRSISQQHAIHRASSYDMAANPAPYINLINTCTYDFLNISISTEKCIIMASPSLLAHVTKTHTKLDLI
jgi:lipoprotein-anchoring transpeptidase ErfK/SrfK